MEITQFALGALSVVFVLFGTATIIGLLKAHAAERELKKLKTHVLDLAVDLERNTRYQFEEITRELRDTNHRTERHFSEWINNVEEACKAYTDSRIDKTIASKSTKAKSISLNS